LDNQVLQDPPEEMESMDCPVWMVQKEISDQVSQELRETKETWDRLEFQVFPVWME
jgi:hypothetical protein